MCYLSVTLLYTLESGIKVGVRLLNFEKNSMIFFLKNDRNALIDLNMNQNFDVKIFRRGATLIQGAMSIPDSRVRYYDNMKEILIFLSFLKKSQHRSAIMTV